MPISPRSAGSSESDIDLGMVTKTEVIDPAVADAAFALKSGEVSRRSRAASAPCWCRSARSSRARRRPTKRSRRRSSEIAETRARSRTRRPARQDRGRARRRRDARRGRQEARPQVAHHRRGRPLRPRSRRQADRRPAEGAGRDRRRFRQRRRRRQRAVAAADGGYLWFDVSGITPSRERTLDEIKDTGRDALARRRDRQAPQGQEPTTWSSKLKGGTALEQLASEAGAQGAKRRPACKRGKPGGFAPAKLVEAAFKTPKDAAGERRGRQETDRRIVFRVTAVDRSQARCRVAGKQRIRPLLQIAYRRRSRRRNISPSWKTISASPSTSEALNQVIGGGTPQ